MQTLIGTSNVLAPGAILVESVEKLLVEIAPRFGWADTWEEIELGCVRDMVPNDVGRLGRPEEIAADRRLSRKPQRGLCERRGASGRWRHYLLSQLGGRWG